MNKNILEWSALKVEKIMTNYSHTPYQVENVAENDVMR